MTLHRMTLDQIDLMEPLAFEQWVLSEIQRCGYDVYKTPKSHDWGADGIARSHSPEQQDLVIQCKHIQSSRPLGRHGIEEVVRAKDRYELSGDPRLLVITNAHGFSVEARNRAVKLGVELIDRETILDVSVLLSQPL